jgi:hypothetical protein
MRGARSTIEATVYRVYQREDALLPNFTSPRGGIEEMREALLNSGIETALISEGELASLYALLVDEHRIEIGKRPAS